MTRIRRHTLIEAIRLKIIMQSIKPGESVPEESLAAEFKVSRTPVREALAALEEIGLVRLEPNKGSRVASISIDAIRSFFEAARPIYVATYGIAAGRRTNKELERLELRLAEIKASLESSELPERVLAYRAFLVDLARISDNPFLSGATERLIDFHIFLRSGIVATLSPSELAAASSTDYDHYVLIGESVRRSDPDAVAVEVREMMQSSRKFLLDKLT